MPESEPTQRSGAEVKEAVRRGSYGVVHEWLRAGELDDYLAGRDPGKLPDPVPDPEPEPEPEPDRGSADQGARPGPPMPGQIRSDELAGMTPEQIVAARRAGRFTELGVGE